MKHQRFDRIFASLNSADSRFRTGARGFAIVLVLGVVVLLTVLILAFFSYSLLQRQIADSSANQLKADVFAQGAVDNIIGDLKQEIVDGSTSTLTVTGTVTNTVYTPSSAATMIPYRAGSDSSWTNLVKRSAFNVKFYPSGNGYAQNGPNRAANCNSTQSSLNGRYYTPARWNDALLLPPTSSTDFTPSTSTTFTAPDWILVAQNGSNPTIWNSNMVASPLQTTTVTGRYAYCIYDEGGLLDVNVVGSPSTPADSQAPYKTAEAYVDLTQLADSSGNPYLTTAQVDKLVNWRNAASLQQTAPSGQTAYGAYVLSNPTGFLKTANTSLTAGTTTPVGQSDNMFTSRQQLINVFNNNLGGGLPGLPLLSALQYMTTFSRDISQPSFAPNTSRPTVLAPSSGGNNATGLDNQINPGFLTVRVTGTFTRNDGTTATVGEPLVKKRFALNRLAWLTYQGPSALRTQYAYGSASPGNTSTDYDMWSLVNTYGVSPALLSQGTAANIQNYFGLDWDATNHRWLYDYHNSAGAPATGSVGAIMRLGAIAALGTSAHEPDFFELLKAGVNVGSIAKAITNDPPGATTSGVTYYINEYLKDYNVDESIIQLGANIISQADVTGYPTRIAFNNGDNLSAVMGLGANIAVEYQGVKNLPYIYRVRDSVFKLGAPTRTDGGSPYAPAPSYATTDTATILDTGVGAYMKLPEIWNPNDYNPNTSFLPETMGVIGPVNFRISAQLVVATTGAALTTEIVVGKSKASGDQSKVANTSLSPGAYLTNFGNFLGEQRAVNQSNTAMTFTIPRTAVGASLFREPTILFQPNLPTGSSLVSPALTAHSTTGTLALNDVAKVSSFFVSGGFNSSVTATDTTTLPTLGNPYIGFYVGSFPLQWADSASSNALAPSYGLASAGNTGAIIYYLQYQDPSNSNNWITYDQKESNHLLINGIMQDPGAGFIHPEAVFGYRDEAIDPRTSRFCFIASNAGNSGSPTFYPSPFTAAIALNASETGWLNMGQGIVLSDRNGTSYGNSLVIPAAVATKALGWYPGGFSNGSGNSPPTFHPGAFSQNNPDITSLDLNVSDQTGSGSDGYPSGADTSGAQYYADPDGVVRRAMAGYSNVATHSASAPSTSVSSTPLYGFPMATANSTGTVLPSTFPRQSDSRPFVLNRPFRSVTELGYTFSGTPWKNVDFFTPESGYSALLDVFCIQDTDSPTALVAGKVNLNTQQVAVLQALISGAYKDEWNSSTSTVPGGTGSLAQQIAQQLVTRTTDVTTKSSTVLVNGPLQNLGELVGKWVSKVNASGGGIDGSKSYSGFSADISSVLTAAGETNGTSNDFNTQRFREATMRALSASGQTRVWNLMIDVVAQVGRYPTSAGSLKDFNVEGEQRYWVHVAIDRFTGQVLDKQVEIIKQ
jgi:Tfp pilus assembly protein PilX